MATLTSPRLGIPYPDGTERVRDGDNAMGAIANYLDALATAGIPYRMAAGRVTINVSASATGFTAVTFPAGRFTQAPIVTLVHNTANYTPAYFGTTTSGFNAYARHVDNASATATVTGDWTATQMLAGAAPG